MAERPELAAGTKERGDCHIDFLAVECITRSPPFSFLSLPSFFPLFTHHRPTNPSIPRIFLLFPKGIRICIFKWNLPSFSMCLFFSFSLLLGFFPGQYPVFRVSSSADLLETAQGRRRNASAVANWFSRIGNETRKLGLICIPILRKKDLRFLNLFKLFPSSSIFVLCV